MWAPYRGQQQPSSTPPAGYGTQPVAPPAGYGAQPVAPPAGYGAQPTPPAAYGAQPTPPAAYGAQPVAPPAGYGAQPVAPPAGYGAQPVAPPAGYGAQPAPPYGLQPVGYEQLPPPQQMQSLQQLAISQAKSEATFVIVFAVIGFFTTPLLFLAAAWARGQRLCRRVREIGAPADVVTKAHIARGIAVGGFALQAILIAALIISENL